jgi:EAL domain-containing protein (putative c-di-GMP-specific phosphodiesterase class I)
MAHGLGLEVVVKGVQGFLRQRGFDELEGHRFGCPYSADVFDDRLRGIRLH